MLENPCPNDCIVCEHNDRNEKAPKIYTDIQEATSALVLDALNAGEGNAEDFNVDPIADKVILFNDTPFMNHRGWYQNPEISDDQFYEIAVANLKEEVTNNA